MKVLKGKTIRKLKEKISSSGGSGNNNNKKRKSKPMIRKIEDGEDLTPEFPSDAVDIIDDIKELERTHDSMSPVALTKQEPRSRSDAVIDYPLDETPSKLTEEKHPIINKQVVVDKVPSQLFAVEEQEQPPKEEQQAEPTPQVEESPILQSHVEESQEEQDPEEAVWKLPEPEIGEEIPDQDDTDNLNVSSSESSSPSDEDENDYSAYEEELGGRLPVAIIGNIVLVTADKEETSPGSPFSTAPTEPVTPEEALKRSFTVESLSDEEDIETNYVHKTTTYTVPEVPQDEATKTLWKSLERNVELSQNLLKEFNCQSHVEKTVSDIEKTVGFTMPKPDFGFTKPKPDLPVEVRCTVQQPDVNGSFEVTVSDPEKEEQEESPNTVSDPLTEEQKESSPRAEERKTVGETIEKKSFFDDTQFQKFPSDDDTESNTVSKFQVPITMDDGGEEEVEESVLTVRMGNVLNTSFEMPFDQKGETRQTEMGSFVYDYVPPSQFVDEEEEFPEDEVDQEASDFFQEIEDQDDGVEETKEGDSAFYDTTLSVAKSVAEGVTADSVVLASAAAQTVATAADTLDKASAPALDTIFEKTSEMTPTVLNGFFNNPKPRPPRAPKQQPQQQQPQIDNVDSFVSDYYSDVFSDSAQAEPDVESVYSEGRGFDKAVDGWFASETFTLLSKHVPDFVTQLVTDAEDDLNQQPDLVAMQ